MNDNSSARMNFVVVLVPGDGDVLVRKLQLKASCFAFLYSLILYWRDKFQPDTYNCINKTGSYELAHMMVG